LEPFDKWALEFVGSINTYSHHNSYILVCIDYIKKLMEAKELPVVKEQEIVGFIHEEIFMRFTIAQEIVTDGGAQFTSRLIRDLMDR
jgi:hypothetical protein